MRKISRRSFIKAATFTAAAAALTACGGSSSSTTTASSTAASAAADNTPSNKGTGVTLTVYTNSETDGRDEWLIERAAQDGFKVQVVGAGAADTQNRLLAEKASPIADVVFGLNAIIWESLKAENILIPFVPEWADEIPAGLNDDEGYYHAIVKQAILLVYDQNQLTEDQAPTDWPDLWTKPEFDKKYEYLTSLAGGTVRNVIAGILTRYADPNGDLGIAQEGWDAIAEYYKHGVPNEDGVDLYAQIASENSTVVCGQMWSSGVETRDQQYGVKTGYVIPDVGVPYAYDDLDRFDAFDLCRILCLCRGIPVGTGKTACEVFSGRFHGTKKRGKLHLSGDPVRDPWNRHQPVTVHFSRPCLLLPKPV